jgi:hypothetical protein
LEGGDLLEKVQPGKKYKHYGNTKGQQKEVRFEVLTAMKVSMLVFWVVSPCGLIGRYQSFGGTYCIHFSPEYNKKDIPKMI